MPEVRQTITFAGWLADLRDQEARKRILARINRIEGGIMGDIKAVGGGVSEVRIDHGPGYRLYFARRESEIVILLCGGDKHSQARDIARARVIAKEV